MYLLKGDFQQNNILVDFSTKYKKHKYLLSTCPLDKNLTNVNTINYRNRYSIIQAKKIHQTDRNEITNP